MRALLKRLIKWALADGVTVNEALTYEAAELSTVKKDITAEVQGP